MQTAKAPLCGGGHDARQETHHMKRAKLIGILTAIVLGLIVILQNTQPVETRILFIKITMPNAILLGLALLVGVAIGILMALRTSGKRDTTRK
jgi:putative membrane protein